MVVYDEDFDYEDDDCNDGFEPVTLTQRYLGLKPYILVELEVDGDVTLEAGGGSREKMVQLSRNLNKLGREMRKQYKTRQKENN